MKLPDISQLDQCNCKLVLYQLAMVTYHSLFRQRYTILYHLSIGKHKICSYFSTAQ